MDTKYLLALAQAQLDDRKDETVELARARCGGSPHF